MCNQAQVNRRPGAQLVFGSRCSFLLKLIGVVLLLSCVVAGAQTFEIVHRWLDRGSSPYAGLVQGTDGSFYGTAHYGGAHGYGTVFRITAEGEHSVLHSFTGMDGRYPRAKLLQARDGGFYGTTESGGAHDRGTVFRITAEGLHSVLHSFNNIDGLFPKAGLVQDHDGSLYGTTERGGAFSYGTVFRITTEGVHTVLFSSFNSTNGRFPRAALVRGSDGNFYGTTCEGGAANGGVVFRITPAGEYTVLHSLNAGNGSDFHTSGLVQGRDGAFYGTTRTGGVQSGTIFRITAEGVYTMLHAFGGTEGSFPRAELVQGSDGAFYGTTQSGGGSGISGTIFRVTATGEHTVLHSFDRISGRSPEAGLVQGSDGELYGTTVFGGASGKGTVFRISTTGTFKLLSSFNSLEGDNPRAELVADSDGALYGTTNTGGLHGYGTVYRITTEREHQVVHSFDRINGSYPGTRLVKGIDGNFYGITNTGGTNGYGTFFQISPAGQHSVIRSFSQADVKDISYLGGLVEGDDGNFYGYAGEGGPKNNGAFLRIDGTGELAVLHFFNDGYPQGALVKGADGSYYGTTYSGNQSPNGSVFRITVEGTYSVLHAFNRTNGRGPDAGLVKGSDGNFYGTTSGGGVKDHGTIFRITAAGVHTVLHSFDGVNGRYPTAPLVRGRDGSLYGTTFSGGANDLGTIFRLTPEGEYLVLHSFTGIDGRHPQTGLTVTKDGSLWGTLGSGNAIYRVHLGLSPVTLLAEGLVYTSATLRGRVIPNGRRTTVQFELGTDPMLSDAVLIDSTVLEDRSDTGPVSVTVSSLQPRTTYYYRIRASEGGASVTEFGQIRSFTTGLADPQRTVLIDKGSPVPGAGSPSSSIPSGATWRRFTAPVFGGSGEIGFRADLKLGQGRVISGIFYGEPSAPLLLVKKGDVAGPLSGAVFSSFRDPVLNSAGEMAFTGTASGAGLPGGAVRGIWSNVGVPRNKPEWLNLVALEGMQAAGIPSGGKWKGFSSVALSEAGVVTFTATLKPGAGGVNAANDFGLWAAGPEGTVLLLRQGQELALEGTTRRVKSFLAFSPVSKDASGEQVPARTTVPVRVTFHDRTQALLNFGIGMEPEVLAATGDLAVAADGTRFQSFGIPHLNEVGRAALRATLTSGSENDDRASDSGIFVAQEDGWRLLVREGDITPGLSLEGAPVVFSSFADPLINSAGQVAFVGKTRGGIAGLWWRNGVEAQGGGELQLVASTATADVPGVPGARFSDFKSVFLPQGGSFGPAFVAKLSGRGVNASNDLGLWSVDSEGALRLLAREGQLLQGKVLRSFSITRTASGIPGQSRSYNEDGQLVFHAIFTDGTQRLIKVEVP